MYDLHAHILPGVDDGAKTPEDTLKMARVAAENGTKVMLATPHRKDITEKWSVSHIQKLLEEMNGCIQREGVKLTLVLGMENHLGLDLPEEVSRGRALTMNGSRYILVEMPFFGRPNYAEEVLFQLQLQGLTPVLAHPERIEAFQKDIALLTMFVERGMLSQVTAGSIVGYFGPGVRRLTATLLRSGLAHIIASDTHFADGPRSPKLSSFVEAAANIIGREKAYAMADDTPRAVLENRPVEVEPPAAALPARRWWHFALRRED